MTPRPDGRPTLAELQAARRREVAARRREITKASREAKGLPSPTARRRPLRLRPSDEPVAPAPPRKGDAEALRLQEAARAALTPEERDLLDKVQAVIRRRADLRLRPEPGVEPPPLPGTAEERARIREKLSEVPAPAPRPRRPSRAARREANREAHADFEDLDALPDDEGVAQRSWAANAGVAEERRLDRELEELI